MLNKLRQKSWYYAVTVTLAGLLLSGLIVLLAIIFGLEGKVKEIDISTLGFGSISALVIGVGGTFIFDKLSKRNTEKLRWVFSRSFMWQLVLFLFTAGVIVASLKTVETSITDSLIVSALGLGSNLTYTAFSLLVFYRLAKVILYKKPN